jgi:tRNA(fMet)-specific endonuclease VapC
MSAPLFLLDTNICIYVLNKKAPAATARLLNTPLDQLGTTSSTAAELRYGAARSARSVENLARVEAFLTPFDVLPFDDAAARIFAPLKAELAARGEMIGPMDVLIAAIALARGATVVTNNTREFRRVRGLAIEDWSV